MKRTRGSHIRAQVLFGLVLVMANLVVSRFQLRLDLTGDKRFTLSPATREILSDLPEAVTVTAYFTGELPPHLALARDEFRDLLVEYAQRSGGNVVYEFIDPNMADSLEEQALAKGIRPLLVNTRAKDKAEQLKVYMGAVVRMASEEGIIPVIQPGAPLEWELSSRIKQVSVAEKPVVGILQGHGEPSIEAQAQMAFGLGIHYGVEAMAIYDTLPIHGRFRSIIIVDPKDTIPAMRLQRLEEFMARGGGVVIAFSGVSSDLRNSPAINPRETGLAGWLRHLGIEVGQQVIVDAQCGQVQVMQQRGFFNVQTAVAFPYFPLVTDFGDHPVTKGLEAVLLQFASPLKWVGTDDFKATPLLRSSPNSNLLSPPLVIDIQRNWSKADFLPEPHVMGYAVEGPFGGGAGSRMVVLGNGDLAVSGTDRAMQINPDNVNLMVNAVDWVSDQTGLIDLRGKEVTYRPIRELEDGQRAWIKWSNLLVPVGLVLLYGLLRAQWRRRQRRQRMRPGHVE